MGVRDTGGRSRGVGLVLAVTGLAIIRGARPRAAEGASLSMAYAFAAKFRVKHLPFCGLPPPHMPTSHERSPDKNASTSTTLGATLRLSRRAASRFRGLWL